MEAYTHSVIHALARAHTHRNRQRKREKERLTRARRRTVGGICTECTLISARDSCHNCPITGRANISSSPFQRPRCPRDAINDRRAPSEWTVFTNSMAYQCLDEYIFSVLQNRHLPSDNKCDHYRTANVLVPRSSFSVCVCVCICGWRVMLCFE